MSQELLRMLAETPLRELARHRWYEPRFSGTPALAVLLMPPLLSSTGRERHKVVVAETEGDRRAVEDALDRPLVLRGNVVDLKATIDRPNLRRSSLPPCRDFGIVHYAPPEAGWPHVVLTILQAVAPGLGLTRDRYAHLTCLDEEEAMEHMKRLAHLSGAVGLSRLRFRDPDLPPPPAR